MHRRFLRQESVELMSVTAFEERPFPPAGDAFASRFMRLPWTERVAVSLIEAWGFTLDEAAWVCDCSRETVARRVAMARRHLGGRSSPSPTRKAAANDDRKHVASVLSTRSRWHFVRKIGRGAQDAYSFPE